MHLTRVLLPLLLIATLQCHAQIHKCKGPDGKVVYSDTLCLGNESKAHVYIPHGGNGAGFDNSEAKAKAGNMKFEADVAEATRNVPVECKAFRYHYGDKTGQELSAKAKQECILNAVASKNGEPVSTKARDAWKDYFDRTDAIKQRALNASKSLNCTPNYGGGMTCR